MVKVKDAPCMLVTAPNLVNANNIDPVAMDLYLSGYLPDAPELRELGEMGMIEDFFGRLSSLQAVKPVKDWLRVRAFLKKMMMATPPDMRFAHDSGGIAVIEKKELPQVCC